MELIDILLIFIGFIMTIILTALVIGLIYIMKKRKVVDPAPYAQAIKQAIHPEIAQAKKTIERMELPPIEKVETTTIPETVTFQKKDGGEVKIQAKKVIVKPKMDLEKELKNFPRKDRKKLRSLYEEYQRGLKIKIEGQKDGKIPGQV